MLYCHPHLIHRLFQLQRRRSNNLKASKQGKRVLLVISYFRAKLETWWRPRNRKILFHSSHGISGISNRNIWSNGKRPNIHSFGLQTKHFHWSSRYGCLGNCLVWKINLREKTFTLHSWTQMVVTIGCTCVSKIIFSYLQSKFKDP